MAHSLASSSPQVQIQDTQINSKALSRNHLVSLENIARKKTETFPPRIPIALHPFLSHGTFTSGLLLFVFTSQIPYLKGIYYTLFTFVLNVDAVKWF